MLVLISHAVEDQPAAAALKELIQRSSLNRIEVWYSSDRSSQGGMPIGGPWFSELQAKLKTTNWIIALATRTSIGSPWLYFECGFAAANQDHSVIPVVAGLPISELPMPLAAYQVYDAENSNSLATLTQKLLEADGITYDEEMTKPVRDTAQRKLIEHAKADVIQDASPPASNANASEMSELKNFIEQRFKELYRAMPEDRRPELGLELKIELPSSIYKRDVVTLNISGGASFGSVLDEIYFRLSGLVAPYTFMFDWTLQDVKSRAEFSLDELKDIVPAASVFKSDRIYKVKLLKKKDHYLQQDQT